MQVHVCVCVGCEVVLRVKGVHVDESNGIVGNIGSRVDLFKVFCGLTKERDEKVLTRLYLGSYRTSLPSPFPGGFCGLTVVHTDVPSF